jgi:hypothetical protein
MQRDKVGYIGWAEVRSPSIADGEHLTSNHSITLINRDSTIGWAEVRSPSIASGNHIALSQDIKGFIFV